VACVFSYFDFAALLRGESTNRGVGNLRGTRAQCCCCCCLRPVYGGSNQLAREFYGSYRFATADHTVYTPGLEGRMYAAARNDMFTVVRRHLR